MSFAMRGVLCFILVVAVCLAAAQECDQECRLLRMEQAIAQQTDVLRALLEATKEGVRTMKSIQGATESLNQWSKWR
jgi:hypothetical protein